MAERKSDHAIKLGPWVVYANEHGELVVFDHLDPSQTSFPLEEVLPHLEQQRIRPVVWEINGAGGGYSRGAV